MLSACSLLVSGLAFAAKTKTPLVLSPQAYANSSYLAQREIPRPENFSDQVFLDDRMSCETKDALERQYDRFERRQQAGLVDHGDELVYSKQVKSDARAAFASVGRQQAKSKFDRFKEFAKDSLEDIREPIAAAVLAAGFYTGKVMKFKMAGMRFESRTAIRHKDASLSMVLPGLTSTVAYTNEDKVSARVSKSIDDNISAVVDTASKGTVQLQYGVSF